MDKTKINPPFMLMIRLNTIEIRLFELFDDMQLCPNETKPLEFQKQMRLLKLHIECLAHGMEDFSWEVIYNQGWLCINDYKIFDELKSFPTADDWMKGTRICSIN